MIRDLKRLSSEQYELLVIGAGIYGATLAWDAALRGLKVALIDRGDFGGATSANSLKTIHGGLRYLQQLDLPRMRQSIHERTVLMRIAPHLVHPLPVLMPTYGYKLKSRPVMAAALLGNDIVGFDRNHLTDAQKYIPPGCTVSSRKLKQLIPGYDKHNLNGGALWYDCQCYSTERLLLSYVISAVNKGADAANYVRASGLLRQGTQVTGVRAEDILSGEQFEIRARLVINESGPWVDEVLSALPANKRERRFLPSTALNLVVNRQLANQYALGLSGPFRHVFADKSAYNGFRILFFSPWRGRTIIGTDHRPGRSDSHEYKAAEKEIQEFLADINKAYPAADIKRQEVTYFNGGFLPMTGTHPRTGEVRLVRHYRIHDHAREDGLDGLLTVIGVKYTTARYVAQETLKYIARKMGKILPRCQTETTRLYGGEIESFAEFLQENIRRKTHGLDERIMRHLSLHYGSALGDILHYGSAGQPWLENIPGSAEVLRAEVLHAVRTEMALKLADVVLRRTDLGSAGNPGEQTLADTAQIMAQELDWSDARCRAEIAAVNQLYVPAPE